MTSEPEAPVPPAPAPPARRPRRRMRSSTVATVIAVAAIVLGVVDSMQTRAHNRLSVKPYLVVEATTAVRGDETTMIIAVSNEGVGPAIIREMVVVLPDELGGGSHPEWAPAVDALRAAGASVNSYWNFEGGEALGVQRSRELVRVFLAGDAPPGLMEVVDRIDVRVRYESIYGEEFDSSLR